MARSEEERKLELARHYAGLSEDELRVLAADSESLSPVARDALRSEIARRKLNIELDVLQSEDPAQREDLVVVRTFRDLPDALIAKDVLTSAGIDCSLADATTIRMDWFWSNALGGIKLCVRRHDAEAAVELLDQERPSSFEVDGVGEYAQPHCPKCNSMDVSFKELYKPVAYGSLFLSVPIPVERRGWKCHACGHAWEEPATPAG
ncbi:MAG TPA: hypothetical protein VLW83_13925 [Candidatus Acidoferrales bacterium]|nr:hypothetical protein [Candidatus Acidoferrales bacterium]